MTYILLSEVVFQSGYGEEFSKYVAFLWGSTHAEVIFSKVDM